MIKLLRGPIDKSKTHLEIDEEILTDISGIEVQVGGESVVVRFSKPPQEGSDVITIGPKPRKARVEKTVQVAQKTFKRLLRKARENAGMSYGELAKAAGLGKSTLSNYENGRGLPNDESLAALNEALGTSWVR